MKPQWVNRRDWYRRRFQLRRADDGEEIRVEETALVRGPGPLIEQKGWAVKEKGPGPAEQGTAEVV